MKSNLISKSETASIMKQISEDWKIELPKIKKGGRLSIMPVEEAEWQQLYAAAKQ